MKTQIIAEIGINHNGDIDLAKKLIRAAKEAGADAVKFQKRTIELVYTKETLKSHRDSPWGKTFEDQKRGLEFNEKEYDDAIKAFKAAANATAVVSDPPRPKVVISPLLFIP